MAGQFEIKPLQGGQFHFVLFDSDGQLLFTGEPCPAIADARAAIAALKERAQAFPNFERKKTADNKMYYTIRTANGKSIVPNPNYVPLPIHNAGPDLRVRVLTPQGR